MQNLFRRFTIMFDYMQIDSDKAGIPTYVMRWTCNQCNEKGHRYYVGHYGAMQDYLGDIQCMCPPIGEQQK